MTPFASLNLAEELRDAHKKLFEKYPSPNRLGLAWTHASLTEDPEWFDALLYWQKRTPRVLQAFDAGHADVSALRLHSEGGITGDVVVFQNAMMSGFGKFLHTILCKLGELG